VWIELEYRDGAVHLLVRDDGIGFDMDVVKASRISRPSLGLAGMEERAALLGGTVEIRSRPKYGTEVEALIPYHNVNLEVIDEHTPAAGG
jgi:signal transduction histidine kinase